MTALYIILAVVAVIMLLLLIPADCILEFSYNNKAVSYTHLTLPTTERV